MTAPYVPQIRLYQQWLAEHRGLRFDDYDALWRWSITDLDGFWQSIWDYFELQSPTPHVSVLSGSRMPDVRWFDGAQCNYVRQVMRHVALLPMSRSSHVHITAKRHQLLFEECHQLFVAALAVAKRLLLLLLLLLRRLTQATNTF